MNPKPLILIDTGIIGGPGRGLFQLARVLENRSLEYLLATFKYARAKSTEFITEATKQRFKLAEIPQHGKLDPRPVLRFISLARRGGFTVIQSHGYKSHFVAAIASKVLGLPWIAFAHGWTAEDRKVQLYHKLDSLLLRYATAVVAVSGSLYEHFSSLRGARRRTVLLLNAVDPETIPGVRGRAAVRAECGLSDDDLLLGCFGRLSREKGQDLLLRSFAEATRDLPQARLLMLGDGPDREMLGALAEDLGIAQRVIFKPHQKQMRDFYQAIDLLVLPSRSEGLPNVVLEAMSFGVPVLGTDVGAVREVIHDGINGWIVPPHDIAAFGKRLREVLTERSLLVRAGAEASQSLYPKFCPRARADKIIALYEELSATTAVEPCPAQ